MRKYQTLCSNTLTKYVLFILLLTVFANIITSYSLPKLDKSLLQNKPGNNTKSKNMIEKAASTSVKGREIKRRSDMNSDLKMTGYITVYPYKGGLGNQMFQLASLIGISRRNNFSRFLCNTDFLPSTVFDIPDDLQMSCNLDLDSFNNYKESSHGKYRDIDLDVNQNWTLEGYFQSYKYFHNCEKEVRNILQFKEDLSQIAERFLRKKVPDGAVTVGIHVRRRDFMSITEQQLGRVVPDSGYISNAMKIFQRWYKNITFIVMSDDQQWCKTNIKGNNVLFSPFRNAGSDLALASRCDHMIVTVGTFGWWGGWMSQGKVIYYSDYPRPGSKIDSEFSKEDYYPDRWIPLHG